QGAALSILTTECYPALDLRVDDHDDPIAELWRLYDVAHERAIARVQLMPTKSDPAGLHQFDKLEAALDERIKSQAAVDFSAFWKTPDRPGAEQKNG
ncbi:MAG: DUF1028 domain-containing protein, partial [Hyphomicrobiaceae bacterium]|nr:DUF1028 domain-containing protein [Hyphomicrobiaceae bacterium]